MATIYWPQHCNIFCCSICWPAPVFTYCRRLSPWQHLHLSPSYDVSDLPNHIFSESSPPGDENDRDKHKYKVLPRPNVCYICRKQGVKGFKILYWLSSCDDKDKDKILCSVGAEYFTRVIFFKWERFSDILYNVNIWLSHNLLGLFSVDEQVLSSVASN